MRLYRHYFWDFDGTLFDSYPHSTAALLDTAAHFGIPADPGAVSRLIHLHFAEAFRALGLNSEQLAFFHARRGDDAFPPPIVPFPHARATLAALHRAGARHYLYTHSNRRMSVRFVEKYGLDGYFADFMAADSPGFASKPAPDALLTLMARHGIDPAEAVMVGDRELDIVSGHNAGIDGMLVDPEHWVGETTAEARVDDLLGLIPEGIDYRDLL